MATGLVKWWRARFLAGYKPFSVIGGNAEGSDSEELLAGVATPCTGSPPPPVAASPEAQPILLSPAEADPGSGRNPTPVTGNDENPTSSTTKQLSFEEFECDVSVAEGDRKRQEFSFTLYDFDGHGKITKDDIAGLVTTIYDTLGASIQVPPCGSKTIKVKLTVSPDQRVGQTRTATAATAATAAVTATATATAAAAVAAAAAAAAASTCLHSSQTQTTTTGGSLPVNPTSSSPPCCHLKHIASCAHASRRIPRRRRPARHRYQTENQPESQSDEEADNGPANRSKQEELRRRVGPVPHLPSPYSNSSEGDISDDSDTYPAISPLTPLTPLTPFTPVTPITPIAPLTPLTPLLAPNQRKRSGALQRQQLLEIIQANMEKNNLGFHTSRKRHQSEQPPRAPVRSPRKEATSPAYKERCSSQAPEPRQQKTAYHRPIRETHNSLSFTKLSAKTRANIRKSRAHQLGGKNTTGQSQPRVLPGYVEHYQLSASNVPRNSPNNNQQANEQSTGNERNGNSNGNGNAKTNSNSNTNTNTNSNGRFVQTQSNGKAGKKHQLKHATREQDQARAMAQVVRWLEREFSQNAVAAASAGRRHVHEHIHHHYHHYHAEALV